MWSSFLAQAASFAVWWPELRRVGPVALVLLVGGWAGGLAVLARDREPVTTAAAREEPLLDEPHMMRCEAPTPVVVLAGLGPGAGVTSLTFNLAVTLAVDGRLRDGAAVRACRPVCLLRDGPLTAALHVSPRSLDDVMATHAHRTGPEVVNLAVRHPSGCELLCLGPGGPAADRLPDLVAELDRWYDAVLVDGGTGDRPVLDAMVEHGDALLLVGLPEVSQVEAAGGWIERVWALGLEERTALLVNFVEAWSRPPRELELAFPFCVRLPADPVVEAMDREGLPWSLDRRMIASRRLAAAARLLPGVVRGAAADTV